MRIEAKFLTIMCACMGLVVLAARGGLDGAPEPPLRAKWIEVKWPFALDQWGTGRTFHCATAECGIEIRLYLRPKLGYCNCTTGIADDAELDRVGERSRPYQIKPPYATPVTALAIAFSDKCDVVVATVVADPRSMAAAESVALQFLNGDLVLRWVERELGI
jgi:hypothetical protein